MCYYVSQDYKCNKKQKNDSQQSRDELKFIISTSKLNKTFPHLLDYFLLSIALILIFK
jgi:hypothetical protein